MVSCKFRKIYKNSFSYRLPPVAASAHVIPHSLPILSHPPSISNRVPPLPFSSRRHYKMNTQNLHLLDISIASNPANIVTFYKKSTRWTATSKKFIFKCESLSYLLNFLSWFLANPKTKFYTRIFLVNIAFSFNVSRWWIWKEHMCFLNVIVSFVPRGRQIYANRIQTRINLVSY